MPTWLVAQLVQQMTDWPAMTNRRNDPIAQ
jgi:hypothetical protein